MNKTETKPARWRPRFSLAALFVAMTVAAVGFGSWSLTKTVGVSRVKQYIERDGGWFDEDEDFIAPYPFVIEHRYWMPVGYGVNFSTSSITQARTYYVWLFGYVIEL